MKEKIIAILSDLRPEFDFTDESLNFIEEGMLDSFDVVCLVDALDTEFNIVIDGIGGCHHPWVDAAPPPPSTRRCGCTTTCSPTRTRGAADKNFLECLESRPWRSPPLHEVEAFPWRMPHSRQLPVHAPGLLLPGQQDSSPAIWCSSRSAELEGQLQEISMQKTAEGRSRHSGSSVQLVEGERTRSPAASPPDRISHS